MIIQSVKQLKAVFVLMFCLLTHSFINAQKKSLLITRFDGHANQDSLKDTFRVQTIVPANITQLISKNAKMIIFIYKPYCPGVKQYFAEEASFLQKAIANGYYVILLATSTENLAQISEIISQKYNLSKLNYYVIDESVDRLLYEQTTLQRKKKRDVVIIRNGQFIHNAWSYELSQEDESQL